VQLRIDYRFVPARHMPRRTGWPKLRLLVEFATGPAYQLLQPKGRGCGKGTLWARALPLMPQHSRARRLRVLRPSRRSPPPLSIRPPPHPFVHPSIPLGAFPLRGRHRTRERIFGATCSNNSDTPFMLFPIALGSPWVFSCRCDCFRNETSS
jgi:hypothetical protein